MADVNWITDLTATSTDLVTAVSTEIINLDAELDVGYGHVNIYTGATTVIPSVVAQELATENKLVEQNIIVEEIPYSQVSNPAGGWTVTIA